MHATIFLAHDPLSSLAYSMITHSPPVAGNLPIKLVARQRPTNTHVCVRVCVQVTWTHTHTHCSHLHIHSYNARKGFHCLSLHEKSHCLGPSKGRHYPSMETADIAYLEEFYRRDNLQLREILKKYSYRPPTWLTVAWYLAMCSPLLILFI